MGVDDRLERLIAAGVHRVLGLSPSGFRALGEGLPARGVVVVPPGVVQPRLLVPLLRHEGKPGFIVEDLRDLDEFTDQVEAPDGLYVMTEVERGDELVNWSPNEALPHISGLGRSPLTLSEGISWVLQEPQRLERYACFMCLGTRKSKGVGFDARTLALWISNGTGRDGAARRNAPKLGWCWAGNRHSWLGFASTQQRVARVGTVRAPQG